ncbi:putative metal-dependent hydrolase of the TIM-barrel fold protein [Brucella abortus A13334]|nr:putative metal-dependent hydrolase of the TIM-barrel fold protein [Brucella abortus A13334]
MGFGIVRTTGRHGACKHGHRECTHPKSFHPVSPRFVPVCRDELIYDSL